MIRELHKALDCNSYLSVLFGQILNSIFIARKNRQFPKEDKQIAFPQ